MYYRLHEKNFTGKVIEFGEMVNEKPFRTTARRRSLRRKTVMGIWLGIELRTGEHRVALFGGGPVVCVRTVIRVPDSDTWKADEIASLKATPKMPNPLSKEQTETKRMLEMKGIDIGGDGSSQELQDHPKYV